MRVEKFIPEFPFDSFTHGFKRTVGKAVSVCLTNSPSTTHCQILIPYDRYVDSIDKGRILTLVEHDVILAERDKNGHSS